jgi:hypothetical protein
MQHVGKYCRFQIGQKTIHDVGTDWPVTSRMDLNSSRVQELILRNRQFIIPDPSAALQITIKTAGSTSGNKCDVENKYAAKKHKSLLSWEKKAKVGGDCDCAERK